MANLLLTLSLLLSLAVGKEAKVSVNFPYEKTELKQHDIGSFRAIDFGTPSSAPDPYQGPECKIYPSDPDWPSEAQWTRLNATVNGNLLKPRPVAAACYPSQVQEYDEDRCAWLINNATNTRFFLDDPLTSLSQWGQGGTCVQGLLNTTGRTCDEDGFPSYVVNASSVRDIQAAVNFARNQNLRLVIKNTGHDFIAKSTGGGSLSVWTHFLKDMEFLDEYKIGEYKGPAARIGAGVEAWEAYNAMAAVENFTVVVPLDPTVGYGGGWILGGGHGPLTSLHGLGVDQILSLNVVTADGRFVTASLEQNRELFFALRGGGGGTFGIVTSVVVKAWSEQTLIGGLTYHFTTGPNHANITIPSDRGFPATPTVHIEDPETFWKAVRVYLGFAVNIVNAGGFGFGDSVPQGNETYLFASTITIPHMSAKEVSAFVKPLFEAYRALGINISSTPETAAVPYAKGNETGVSPASFPSTSDRFFISRLLPRRLWTAKDSVTLLDRVVAANRRSAELGYRATTRAYAPTAQAAGYPAGREEDSAVNPAMRNMVMHTVTFASTTVTLLDNREMLDTHANLSDTGVKELRALTPESGAYFNEADRLEPGFQKSFWGNKYDRLLKVKKAYDPWGLFWAPTPGGSEAWEITPGVKEGEMPTQDGRLCRAKS